MLIALLGLVFFADLVLHPTQALYADHSDLVVFHVPLKRFLVHWWQETGSIPLWNPQAFAGMPFMHDVEVAAFYPLHYPLYLLPEERLGIAPELAGRPACDCGRLVHVCLCPLAGVGARQRPGGGFGYMFAGKWLLHMLGGDTTSRCPWPGCRWCCSCWNRPSAGAA